MEKEISDDSYCTTDEGEEEPEKGYESDTEEEIPDSVGQIVKIKDNKIIKEILQIGQGTKKPSEIDNVIITSQCCYQIEGKIVDLPELSFKDQEFSLDNSDNFTGEKKNSLPKVFIVAFQTMRKNEKAKITAKFDYIFKHFEKLKKNFPEFDSHFKNSIFLNEDFKNQMKNEMIIINLTLNDFFICQNLMDRGEIRKKIIKNGTSWRYARNPDIVTYNLSCFYDNKIIFERKKMTTELDCNKLFEIERRVLQNLKVGESALWRTSKTGITCSVIKMQSPAQLKPSEST